MKIIFRSASILPAEDALATGERKPFKRTTLKFHELLSCGSNLVSLSFFKQANRASVGVEKGGLSNEIFFCKSLSLGSLVLYLNKEIYELAGVTTSKQNIVKSEDFDFQNYYRISLNCSCMKGKDFQKLLRFFGDREFEVLVESSSSLSLASIRENTENTFTLSYDKIIRPKQPPKTLDDPYLQDYLEWFGLVSHECNIALSSEPVDPFVATNLLNRENEWCNLQDSCKVLHDLNVYLLCEEKAENDFATCSHYQIFDLEKLKIYHKGQQIPFSFTTLSPLFHNQNQSNPYLLMKRYKVIGDFLARKRMSSVFYDSLLAELKSDHAGEYGAVRIYDGIEYSVTKLAPVMNLFHGQQLETTNLLAFAQEHRETEIKHLRAMEQILPNSQSQHTKLIPVWRSAGFMLGLLPAIVKGPKGVYQTVSYVEEFVDKHYQAQIDLLNLRLSQLQQSDPLDSRQEYETLLDLRDILIDFQSDEKSHMQDAQSRLDPSSVTSISTKIWKFIVQQGSIAAVIVSKKL